MLDPTHHKLQERVKELTALHRTARLLQDDSQPPELLMREIATLLPPAWQYPEVTEARIRFEDIDVATPGFVITPWLQRATFLPRLGNTGTIEIVYTAERPPEVEGVFLAEERDLIDSLAEMLRAYFQKKLADRELQQAHENLEQLVAARTSELQATNAELAKEIERHQLARKQIEEYQDRLRKLATELTLAEAKERRELAVDLHDHISQEFAFIKMRLQQFKGDAIFCGFENNLDEILSLVDKAIQYTRKLTYEISSPILYELGLSAALEWLAEQFEKKHQLKVVVTLHSHPLNLSEAIRVMLFKSVNELLTNCVKYAQASKITITVERRMGKLAIVVADDGVGFDTNKLESVDTERGGFGLFSIRERLRYFGGEMSIVSILNCGTTITIAI